MPLASPSAHCIARRFVQLRPASAVVALQTREAISAGPGLHGIAKIVPASSSATRNPAIVIGAVCGLLGGLLLLAAGLLAIMARRRSTEATRKLADEGQAEHGALPIWVVRFSRCPNTDEHPGRGWRAHSRLCDLCA